MEKILGFDLNKIIRGNSIEDLTYIDRTKYCDRMYLRNLYVAEEDGIVLYGEEKVEYSKGDLIISLEFYRLSTEDNPAVEVHKVVNTRTTDIAQVIKELVSNEVI